MSVYKSFFFHVSDNYIFLRDLKTSKRGKMAKEHYGVIVIVGVVLVVAIGLIYFAKTEGRAFASPPTAAPAPPAPTPVPRHRITVEEIAKKPEKPKFPPEIAYWLTPGKLTNHGDAIKQVKIKPISPEVTKPGRTPIPPDVDQYEFNIVRGILKYVKNFDKFKSDPGCAQCFNRDVNNVFSNGISRAGDSANCGHYALLFVTLARLHGIPVKFIDVYMKDWADEQKRNGCWDGTTKGHSFAQVYIEGGWYCVDPMSGFFARMDEKGNVLNSDGTVQARIMAEGRDNSDFMQSLERFCIEGYRYNNAIPGLPLCKNAQYGPTFEQWQTIQICKSPLTIKPKI